MSLSNNCFVFFRIDSLLILGGRVGARVGDGVGGWVSGWVGGREKLRIKSITAQLKLKLGLSLAKLSKYVCYA